MQRLLKYSPFANFKMNEMESEVRLSDNQLMDLMQYQDISLKEVEVYKNRDSSVLVDVREDWEFEEFNIGGINIPLAEIRQRRDELSVYTTIIVVCTNGIRSKVAAKDYCRFKEWSDKQIYHLKGGILEVE